MYMQLSSRTYGILLFAFLSMSAGRSAFSQEAPEKLACLDSCIVWTERNFSLPEQQSLIAQAANLKKKTAQTAYIPEARIYGFGGWIEGLPIWNGSHATSTLGWLGSAGLRQTVWDGGETYRQKKIAETESLLQEMDLETRKRDLKKNIGELYFGILLLQEQQKLLASQKEVLEKYRKLTEAAVRNGVAFQSEADKFRLSVLDLEQQELTVTSALEAAVGSLSVLTGKDLSKASFSEPEWNLPLSDSLEKRPEMKIFSLQREMVDIQANGWGRFLPRIDIVGQGFFLTPEAQIGDAAWNRLVAAGISFSWSLDRTIYSAGYGKKLAKIEYSRLDNARRNFLISTRSSLEEKMSQIRKWDRILEKDEEIIALRRDIRESYQTRFDNGALGTDELLEALRQEGSARAQRNLHRTERLQAIFLYMHELGL